MQHKIFLFFLQIAYNIVDNLQRIVLILLSYLLELQLINILLQ